MGKAVFPRSLRGAGGHEWESPADVSGVTVSAVAGLIAVASFSSAEAQQAPLPSVNVEAPVARPKPAASRPSTEQIRARDAMRRAARQQQQQQVAAPVSNLPPDRNPYSSPASDYKGERLQASGKFPEKLLNTPKTVTVLSKEILADKNSTSLKSAVLSTAGVTLGTGEGGNAFGDRFFIRGFDARNDVFIDGVRDAGVSVRENFFTEQVEILRGPASSFAGRGTTGGAINIVTKQATTENSFYNMDTTLGTDQTKRVVIDVNQKITPTFAARVGGLFQDAGVAGRDYVTDNRNGGFIATKWTPLDTVTLAANYIHSEVSGRPDFGVPYYRPSNLVAGAPFPEVGAPRTAWYGFVNRDFQRIGQDIGSFNAEVKITPDLTISDKVRVSRSTLNYIGTLPEGPTITNPIQNSVIRANPQSRFQQTDVLANQLDATYKFDTGPFKHTLVAGLEVSQEKAIINSYTGLTSEQQGLAFAGNGSLSNVSVFNPQFTNLPFGIPSLGQFPTNIKIDTASVYALDSVNYRDFVILNGGVRYDKYDVRVDGFGTVNGVANTPGSTAASSGLPNFNVGLTLKPLPYASVYAAYATSSNPVGAEFDGLNAAYGGLSAVTNGGANQVFGPEKNTSIEIGTKWELLDGRLLVTGALFQTEKENARESRNIANRAQATADCPYPVGTTGNVPCLSAGAAYRIRGIDLQAGGKLTDKWSIFGGLVLMESEVTKSNIPPANTALFTSNVGLQLANTAHQSFSLLTKYQLNDTWEIGGQAVYRSKIYGGTWLAANQGTELPSYWRFDAFAEAKINKNWTAKVFVANIFDKLYYDAFYQSATPFSLVGPGRSASIVVSGRF
ncbi:TonB-dependent receptor [Bradyrhizobium sp. HKCCYLR20261]|uniref:TonB-dependent receptor n=1 Tax=unclassified Bradyrhizobium TaxID=2631580 RepID=UPI003EBD0809